MNIPLRVFSDHSIQRAFCHIPGLVEKAFELKLSAIALTDYHSVSGIPEFLQTLEKKNKKAEHKVKPICGLTLYVKDGDSGEWVTLLAKNKDGWFNLVKLCSLARENDLEPGVTYDVLGRLSDNLILLASSKFHSCHTSLLAPSYNYETELGAINKTGVFYLNQEDHLFQKIIICSKLKTTISKREDVENTEYAPIFNNNEYFVYADESPSKCDQIVALVEEFKIEDKPCIPDYIDENGVTITDPNEYLTNLCRAGWKTEIADNIKSNDILQEVYVDRVKEELGVIKSANISNYLLLVMDLIQHSRKQGRTTALRGSAGGCLVMHLIGINDVDPVWPDKSLEYNPDRSLLFARFINKGRFSEGRISLPDVDIDFNPSIRDSIKKYASEKYGVERAANIVTFGKMKGASAIKEVFRVLELPVDAANRLTKIMVPEAAVQDEIEDSKDENPDYNIINYCIDNIPQFNKMYKEFPKEIDIAIKLSNTIRSEGQHAAALIMAAKPISDFMPTKIDPDSKERICCFKMQDVEYCGGVKMDLLSVLALEKTDIMIGMINDNL